MFVRCHVYNTRIVLSSGFGFQTPAPALGRDANGVVRARGAIRLYEPRALHRKGKSLKMAVGKNKRMSKGKKGGKKKAYV